MLDLFLFLLMVLIVLPLIVGAVIFCGNIAFFYSEKLVAKIKKVENEDTEVQDR